MAQAESNPIPAEYLRQRNGSWSQVWCHVGSLAALNAAVQAE
jgi:hypothetical protein